MRMHIALVVLPEQTPPRRRGTPGHCASSPSAPGLALSSSGPALLASGLAISSLERAFSGAFTTLFLTQAPPPIFLVEKAMGGLLVLTGVAFLTGAISEVSYWLLDTFPVLGKIG